MSNTQVEIAWLVIGLATALMLLAAAGIQHQLRKIRQALKLVAAFDAVGDLPVALTPVLGYMCRIDFEEELGRADGGNVVFASPEDCRECRECAESCGIVEVRVSYVRTVLVGSKFDSTDPLQEDAEEPT